MEEIVRFRSRIWVIFGEESLFTKPICKVLTESSEEEYRMGIQLRKAGMYAIEERELVEEVTALPVYPVAQFIKADAPR